MHPLLSYKQHRVFPISPGSWDYYQQWNRLIFMHWKVSIEVLRPLAPSFFELDLYQGEAYVSLVPFTMEKVRPKFLPAWSFISDFHEINLRTYVTHKGITGVYFINIEAGKFLSAFLFKQLSGLPYEKAVIERKSEKYQSRNVKKNFYLQLSYQIQEEIRTKTPLDFWLTERYYCFCDIDQKPYQYDLHHKEWDLFKIELQELNLHYQVGTLLLDHPPLLAHYSKGVEVLAWNKKALF